MKITIINKLLDHTSPVKAKTPETHPTSDVQINGKKKQCHKGIISFQSE